MMQMSSVTRRLFSVHTVAVSKKKKKNCFDIIPIYVTTR